MELVGSFEWKGREGLDLLPKVRSASCNHVTEPVSCPSDLNRNNTKPGLAAQLWGG